MSKKNTYAGIILNIVFIISNRKTEADSNMVLILVYEIYLTVFIFDEEKFYFSRNWFIIYRIWKSEDKSRSFQKIR